LEAVELQLQRWADELAEAQFLEEEAKIRGVVRWPALFCANPFPGNCVSAELSAPTS